MRPRIGILCNLSDHDGGAHSPRDLVVHAYSRAVVAAGGAPFLIPCLDDADTLGAVLEAARGLVISGGSDVDPRQYGQEPRRKLGAVSPQRDALDRIVLAWALERPDFPVLGICRGIQALNVFAGGSLIQDIPTAVTDALKHSQQAPGWHGTHGLDITRDTLPARLLGEGSVVVNSYHHQAVSEPAPGFRAVARAADGVIEAIERDGARFCLGVQFHPELMAARDPRMARLFEGFVEAAGERRE